MAKVSVPLAIPEEDVQKLMEIARGPDKELGKRAQIVLACREPDQLKIIATRFGVAGATVGHWKEAYRNGGIDGIGYTKTGRPVKSLPVNFDELVLNASKEAGKWTNESLAKHLGVSLAQVEKSLQRQKLSLKHTSRWYIQTFDALESNSVELVGVWLGQNEGAFITCTNLYGLTTKPGYLTTRSSALAKALSRGTVDLENALVEATRHENTFEAHHEGEVYGFLEEYFQNAPKAPDLCYQIFGFGGEGPKQLEVRLADTTISWTSDMKQWTESLCSWIGSRGSSVKHAWAERIVSQVMPFIVQNARGTYHIFQWSKEIEHVGSKVLPVVTKNEVPSLPSLLLGESLSQKVDEEQASLGDGDGNRLDLVLGVAALSNGSYSCSTVSCTVLEDVSTFSFASADDFLEGLFEIEEPILKASEEAGMRAMQLSIEELKKRRTARSLGKSAH